MAVIKGVKSVDFKVVAEGEGIVNWNGSYSLYNPAAEQSVKNHALPKLRGIDPLRLKSLNSEALAEAKLFVSQNCVKSFIFKNENYGVKNVNRNNVGRALCSMLGLMRGYVIAEQLTSLSLKRKSPLLLEDFVDKDTKLRYEQFANGGEKNETSIFSKTMVDSTKYEAYGSICIEDLEFIVLEDSFNRSSYSDIITIEEGKLIGEQLEDFLNELAIGTDKKPKATFHENYVRIGGITNEGEAGLLLNNDAIELVVEEILQRIRDLYVRQSKGYFVVTSLIVDYNSGRAMRIKKDIDSASPLKEDFAVYFKPEPISEKEFVSKMKAIADKKQSKSKKAKTNSSDNKSE